MPGTDGIRSPPADGGVAEFFGDLTRSVALDAPVSHAALRRALDQLADRPPDGRPATTVGEVSVRYLDAGEWHRHARERDVAPSREIAAREVHRRMARSLGTPPPPPRADPFVIPP